MNPLAKAEAERAGALYGLTVDEVMSRSRTKTVFEARAIAVWVLRQRNGFSYPELGRMFGRDHNTMMNSIQRVETELRENSTSLFAHNAMIALTRDEAKAAE